MDYLITIAIPFFNSEQYLAYAIQSVINQTYKNWELLLIDDGGKDNSLKVAKEYADRDSRIYVISDGMNKHLAVRLNESVRMARGEYYVRMDDDDIMVPNRIEKQLSYFIYNHNLDVVGSSAMLINGQNVVIGSQDMSGVTTGFIHPTIMARTKWLLENPYSEELPRAQDLDLWLRTSSISNFYNIPEPLLFYRTIDSPSDSRYIKSMKSLRIIADRYSLYNKNIFWKFKVKVKSYLQTFIFEVLLLIGKTNMIVRLRNIKKVPCEISLTNEVLEASIKAN